MRDKSQCSMTAIASATHLVTLSRSTVPDRCCHVLVDTIFFQCWNIVQLFHCRSKRRGEPRSHQTYISQSKSVKARHFCEYSLGQDVHARRSTVPIKDRLSSKLKVDVVSPLQHGRRHPHGSNPWSNYRTSPGKEQNLCISCGHASIVESRVSKV